MPITFALEPDRQLVVFRQVGEVSDEELLTFYRDFFEDPKAARFVNLLVDLEQTASADRSTQALRSLVSLLEETLAGSSVGRRVAVIAPKDHSFGLARMYEGLSARIPWEFCVFRDADAAREWLDAEGSEWAPSSPSSLFSSFCKACGTHQPEDSSRSTMESMKAIARTEYGPPEVLRLVERPKPVPRDNELLLKVYATSVTNSDLFIRGTAIPLRFLIPLRIMMGIRRPRKEIIGEVLAGEVEVAGSRTKRFRAGDQVYGLTGFSLGAYADYKVMKEVDSKRGCLALMPKNVSFEEATSAAYGGLLALQALEPADIQPGQKVLVYGAASTSGTVSVQYAKHKGAEVTGVCSAGKADFVRSLGADKILDYTDDRSIDRLETYDLVMDAVGKSRSSALKEACRDHVRDKKHLVSIDGSSLLLDSARLARVADLVESGAVRPINDRVYPFEQMVEAHQYVETGHKQGNVAVTVNRKA